MGIIEDSSTHSWRIRQLEEQRRLDEVWKASVMEKLANIEKKVDVNGVKIAVHTTGIGGGIAGTALAITKFI